jgi:hypothetical protein
MGTNDGWRRGRGFHPATALLHPAELRTSRRERQGYRSPGAIVTGPVNHSVEPADRRGDPDVPEEPPMTDPLCTLIVDSNDQDLAELPLRILRIGVDVFYARNWEEGWLLARQEASRIRLLLFPPSVDFEHIQGVFDCLHTFAGDIPRSLVVVGLQPDEPTRTRLRGGGVELALWEPFDESALRQVLSNALSVQDRADTRAVTRFPTTLLGRTFWGIRRRDVVVSTLSQRGAFLETPFPFPAETRITLEVALPEDQLVTKATVVYSRTASDRAPLGQPPGMGVTFTDLDRAVEDRLERFLARLQDRFGV